jgi:hypothetical protein
MSKSAGHRVSTIAAASLIALAVGLSLWGARPAEAAFPGNPGLIAIVSNMKTGTGANDP